MFENPPEKVLYCYGIYQPLYETMEKELPFITFQQGLLSTSDLEALAHDKTCNLVCLDDLMESVIASSEMENLFVKGMHHRHLSVIFLNQNMYCQGKHSRTISLNSHILVLMKNPRDQSQIQCLARQAFMGKSKFLLEAFKDATCQPYGYLVLDFSPSGEEAHRVRTRIFPEEDTIIYQPI